MTQCMSLHASDQGFPNKDGRISLSGGGWETFLGGFNLYDVGLTCVYKEYEIKIKMVQLQ